MTLHAIVSTLLQQDDRFVSEDGILLKNTIREQANKLDEKLISLLLENDVTREKFFIPINDVLVFDINKFSAFINNKEFLPDSYTSFKNKIGLTTTQWEFIASSNEVVLSFPFKDCVLAWWQDKEDAKRDEIFYNEILWSDDIDRLLDKKVFTNFKKIDNNWEHKLDSFTRDEDGTIKDNLIIKWNNLLALHSLKSNFAWKVKLIYIDPPYNTGNDGFKYNDRFNHSTWLTFMKNRLEVAKELLRDDWAIFVQCDDNEQAYLKVLMDEIFGREKFLNSIIIKSKASSWASWWWEDKKLKKNVEYIHTYNKWISFISFNTQYQKQPLNNYINWLKNEWKSFSYNQILINEWKKEYFWSTIDGKWEEIKIFKHTNYQIKTIQSIIKEEWINEEEVYFKYIDKIFTTENAQTSIRDRVIQATDTEDTFYTIEYKPVSGKNKWEITNLWFIGKTKRLVSYLKNTCCIEWWKIYKLNKLWALWSDLSWSSVFLEWWVKLENWKKPEKLIQRIINLATQPWDIVLDYHLWSGTTCAVAHKMWRQYIGIEQMDYIETISVERMKKVIAWEQGWISKSVNWQGGWEFVYMELMEENHHLLSTINTATTIWDLQTIYENIKNNECINYTINPEDLDVSHIAEGDFEDFKKFLLEIIDKNLLYKNFSEIDDKNSEVTKHDKNLNKNFYNN